VADAVKVDHPGMGLGAVAHEIAAGRTQVDGKAEAVGDDGFARNQRLTRMQGGKVGVGQDGLAVAKADLVQALAFADKDGKAARADLGIEGTV
jgi:hypothetical protein